MIGKSDVAVDADRVVVKVFGREYRLRSDAPAEHLHEVAAYVDRVIRDAGCRTPDTQDAAILAALNLASELLRAKEFELVPRDRIQSLIDLIDSV